MPMKHLLARLLDRWKRYKYRFLPWIAFNLKDRSVRSVPKGGTDAIIPNTDVNDFLLSFFTDIHKHDHDHDDDSRSQLMNPASLHRRNLDAMHSCLGYMTERHVSQIEGCGRGVVVTKGTVPAQSVVSMYPGTIYQVYEPIFFQSLANPFIFRCIDGVLIDGNDKNLSKFLYKSCHGRDRIGPYESCDRTWLTPWPHNPLAVGQYVNNQTHNHPANVCYQEFDVPVDFPVHLMKYIPNAHYSASINDPGSIRTLRVVVLVSTREISTGEELFSSYFTVVH